MKWVPRGGIFMTPALDSAICEEFMGVWEQAMEGKFSLWLTYPSGALAYCILLDQFSRNMFRGQRQGVFCRSRCIGSGEIGDTL